MHKQALVSIITFYQDLKVNKESMVNHYFLKKCLLVPNMLFWPILIQFWCPIVTLVTLKKSTKTKKKSLPHKKIFEKNNKKNYTKPKWFKIFKNDQKSKKLNTSQNFIFSPKYQPPRKKNKISKKKSLLREKLR